jgi:hypothetical protein
MVYEQNVAPQFETTDPTLVACVLVVFGDDGEDG